MMTNNFPTSQVKNVQFLKSSLTPTFLNKNSYSNNNTLDIGFVPQGKVFAIVLYLICIFYLL